MKKRCKQTIDWLEVNYGVGTPEEIQQTIAEKYKDDEEKQPISKSDNEMKAVELSTEEQKNVESLANLISGKKDNDEAEYKITKDKILTVAKTYNSKYEFMADEDIFQTRYVGFKKEGESVTILSITKEELEEEGINFQLMKKGLNDFIVLPQTIKEDEFADTFKNESLINKFESKHKEKINVNPDELLNSIKEAPIDAENDELGDDPEAHIAKKKKRKSRKKLT